MVIHLNQFLENLKVKLPEVCSDRDLVEHLPDIFKNQCSLSRMRTRGQTPPYFLVPPHVHYLREDIICWLRDRYQGEAIRLQKQPSKLIKKQEIESESLANVGEAC